MDKETIIKVLFGVFGASGFWAVIQSLISQHQSKKANRTSDLRNISKGLLAVLHERLYALCDKVIDQNYITQEQLENLTYMKEPYFALGGDGTLEKMINIIDEFEIKKR